MIIILMSMTILGFWCFVMAEGVMLERSSNRSRSDREVLAQKKKAHAKAIKAKKAVKKREAALKPVEKVWDAHLEVPQWRWYDDLLQRVNQIETEEQLDKFDASLYGHRIDFMGYTYDPKDRALAKRELPKPKKSNSYRSDHGDNVSHCYSCAKEFAPVEVAGLTEQAYRRKEFDTLSRNNRKSGALSHIPKATRYPENSAKDLQNFSMTRDYEKVWSKKYPSYSRTRPVGNNPWKFANTSMQSGFRAGYPADVTILENTKTYERVYIFRVKTRGKWYRQIVRRS